MPKNLGQTSRRHAAGRWRSVRVGILLIVVAAGAFWITDQFGWVALPEKAPTHVQINDPALTDPGREATQQLAAMRGRTGIPGASAAVAVDGKVVWAAAVG